MSDEPGVPADGGDQRELIARLRAVIEARDAENAMLRAELEAQRERYRRLELRVAELERRLGSDSTTSGTPRTLPRWCRIRSYLDSTANHGLTALDAITRALAGDPWLPAPAAA